MKRRALSGAFAMVKFHVPHDDFIDLPEIRDKSYHHTLSCYRLSYFDLSKAFFRLTTKIRLLRFDDSARCSSLMTGM